jgi:hypothetical protein
VEHLEELDEEHAERFDRSWHKDVDQHGTGEHQPSPTTVWRHQLIFVVIASLDFWQWSCNIMEKVINLSLFFRRM